MKTLRDERLETSPELGQGPCSEGADIDEPTRTRAAQGEQRTEHFLHRFCLNLGRFQRIERIHSTIFD
ncbi:hypothetical protein [Rhizobium leguminosarum]|uniref:hypothetical protein n=1 Tax=Rhizobium leguminosarum TaxID=384 RepID=UPI0014410CF4|nr:hypothetical protein [Rhizobium leguminosarum]MBY5869657.1 hypothetical protein [Rhizobium leguminosarum]NKM08984.1 hypothetical protein [Rhizobium leguminosarum bv. viciae]